MKIHEYQAKELLKKYQIPIQDGFIVEDANQITSTIEKTASTFNCNQFVIKAQIHAGGRGKGGGVKFSPDAESAKKNAEDILGMNLVTHQTDKNGQLVRKIMISEAIDIKEEYYVAITLDRACAQNVFMVCKEGGVEIEEVAKRTPEVIYREIIHPTVGLRPFQAQALAAKLDLKGEELKQAIKLFINLYKCYIETDASIAEINPLVQSKQGQILALDAKFNFDSNALYRHPEIVEMRDIYEENPSEVEADKYHLNYIKLDGNVGCMVNGAGLAMATMDIIKQKGGEPANFLDVGGGANIDTVKNGFKIILSDKNVKCVLINIFGGIVRCDRVVNGIVEAVKDLNLNVPVVVRLQGTNHREAKEILKNSEVDLISADTLSEAAEKAVELTN